MKLEKKIAYGDCCSSQFVAEKLFSGRVLLGRMCSFPVWKVPHLNRWTIVSACWVCVAFVWVCVCVYVWVYGAVSWWKPSADAYIRAAALIKGQQAVLLSLWEQHRFLLPLWQQDKVPFQLEKYLATYLPTAIPGFYFSCHLIRNPCYFYGALSYHPVRGVHMQTPLLTAASDCCIIMCVRMCMYRYINMVLPAVSLFICVFIPWKGRTEHSCDLLGGEMEGRGCNFPPTHTFCMRKFALLCMFVLMSFCLDVSCLRPEHSYARAAYT